MATTTLSKTGTPGAVMLRYLIGKFDALRYLPKLANAFLRFNASGDLVADNGGFDLKTAAFTAVSGGVHGVNTTSAAITVTLPASAEAGDQVVLFDPAGTWDSNNVTVARNGHNINSAGSNLTLSTEYGEVVLRYINSTIGWRTYYGGTAADTLAVSGAATVGGTLGVTGMLTATGGLKGGVQALSGPGAVNLTTLTTTVTTTGADALTLADGTAGQVKVITMIVDGGDGTLTPTNFGNGTTITFADVGDSVTLQFLGTDWWVISNNGATVA